MATKKKPGRPSSAPRSPDALAPVAKKVTSGANLSSEGPKASSPAGASAPASFDLKTAGRTVLLRVGIPVVIGWVIALMIRHWIAYAIMGVLTVAVAGLLLYLYQWSSKARRVQSIVTDAKTKEERAEAIEKLERDFKKDDSAALFAKAQLQMQEDPRAALATLETIDLAKVLPNIADEARGQRAMIHLMLGEPQTARPLADGIDLGRHDDPRAKAMLAAVVCEAWARTGQAKRAAGILELFSVDDPKLEAVRPGLLRAQVFTYGAIDDMKQATKAMHQLGKQDPRMVAGFAQRGVHPLLVKEARKILERSGALPKIVLRGGPGR